MSAKIEKDDCCKDPHCEDSECLSPEERLKKLYTIPAEVASQLPAEGLKRLEAVIELQKEHDQEYKNLVEEVRAIQLRYEEKFVELYKQRQAIVVGEVDPAGSDASKGISEFWFNVLKNSTLPIEEYDLEPLKSLTNVEYQLLPENKGYKLAFHFAPNDFFSNSVLTKTFHIDGFMSQGEEDVYLIDGTEIDWKSGKNVTVKLTEKKVGGGGRGGGRGGKGKRGGKRGGGGGGPTKTVLVEEEVPSFFRFFEPVADIEKIDPNEDQETYIMTLQQYQQDQYLGAALKDKIIPQAPLYFNGVVADDESDDEDGLYGMGSDEDEDDDEDERALAAAFDSARSQAGGKKRGGGGGSGGRGGKPSEGGGGLPFSFSAPAGGAGAPPAASGGAAPAPFKFSFNPPPAAASGGAAPAAAASGEAAPFKFSFNAPPK